MQNHATYEAAMQRALELALLGPFQGVNPQVGCVLLGPDGSIAAEGFHKGSGTDHAEVMALKSLREKENFGEKLPSGYTAVVTLEPCNHTGKTGPCAQALIAAGISKVVYASSDPGSVSGNGSETLRAAGIEVVGGFMKEVADEQSRIWLTANRLKRPFVTIKWASSLDGRAAANDGSSKWISGEQSRADVHLRRSRADAILVGTGTVLADDPELTARKPDGSLYETQPLRVILGKTKVAESFRIFNDAAKTVHIETQDVKQALAALWDQGIKHVFVEGGPKVASSFIAAGFADEILIYLAPMLIGGSRTAIAELGVNNISEAIQLEVLENKSLGKDIFIRAKLGGK